MTSRDLVELGWGFVRIVGTVAEVYGLPERRMITGALIVELSSHVIDEPPSVTTSLAMADLAAYTRAEQDLLHGYS